LRENEEVPAVTETLAAETQAAEPHAFQADVARLLHLMVHSIYSEREIFLRELISNAADACEKLRYEALAHPDLTADGAPFAISLILDKEAGTLTVADNGIGMSKVDLVEALGTIASSGTRAFLDRLGRKEEGEDREEEGGKGGGTADLIGQFGIGFYSAFMVADHVVVETRRAGAPEAWRWSSDGKGTYEIAPLPLEAAPTRGTRVILHLNAESKDYADTWRVEKIVREHSGAIAVPIELRDSTEAEAKKLTDGAAVWAKPKSAITEAEYTDFYHGLSGQFDEPALTVHWRAEGRHEYTVLAFVPGARPFDLFDPERKARTKLYVRRVLISQDSDLLPGWLRFVRLVVDSGDLPLNVSREMIQASPVFAAIKRGIVNRLLQELTKFAEHDAEKFGKVWENFGAVLKEGLYEDPERRDQLFKLARFTTTKHSDGTRTLAQYVADLRPNQTAIYYMTGDEAKRLAASPQLEGYRTRGVEVLLLSDPVDAFWVQTALGYEGKPFKSVTQGTADLKLVPVAEGEEAPSADTSPEVATLLAFFKQTLGDSVEDVRASDRLSESPACLVAPENGPDRRLEKILAQHGRLDTVSKPVLEVNPHHALITGLARRFKDEADKALVEDAAWLLHDEARLMDGDTLENPAAFAARLTRVLARATG
jgi:molecular chaperone HtpG